MDIYFEGPSGERFQATVPDDTPLSTMAADFAEARGWPLHDQQGRGQRAVIELVNPNDPDDTKRLNGERTVGESGLRDGDVLRVFPEAMAGGMVDERDRLRALISDQNELQNLCAREPQITFTANRAHAPDRYEVTLRYPGFKELPPGERVPTRTDEHKVEIVLGGAYPREAPRLRWLTPIFHPNIQMPEGGICLGELHDRYLPGMGLARMVRLLADLVQYRNFNPDHGVNQKAVEWVRDPANWDAITAVGGYPFQGTLEQIFREWDRGRRKPVTFKPVN